MSDYSEYVNHFKPVYCVNPKFVPWGYDQSPDDTQLFIPNKEHIKLLEYILKRVYIGATYGSAARVLKDLSGRTVTPDGVGKLFRKWLKFKTEYLRKAKIEHQKNKHKQLEEKLGQRVGIIGAEHRLSQETSTPQEEVS